MLTFDNKRLREIASAAPYEFVEIVVNDRKYGGGGIFNLYATVAADNAFTPYVFVHEFGHHFAGLADEYYTSDVAYGSPAERPEPWEPNAHRRSARRQVEGPADAPESACPTPWPKQEFETEEQEIQARRRAIRAAAPPRRTRWRRCSARSARARPTAARAPAPTPARWAPSKAPMYEANGYYRPQQDCIMFTRDEVGFCAVCRRAIERIIAMYAK